MYIQVKEYKDGWRCPRCNIIINPDIEVCPQCRVQPYKWTEPKIVPLPYIGDVFPPYTITVSNKEDDEWYVYYSE